MRRYGFFAGFACVSNAFASLLLAPTQGEFLDEGEEEDEDEEEEEEDDYEDDEEDYDDDDQEYSKVGRATWGDEEIEFEVTLFFLSFDAVKPRSSSFYNLPFRQDL